MSESNNDKVSRFSSTTGTAQFRDVQVKYVLVLFCVKRFGFDDDDDDNEPQ